MSGDIYVKGCVRVGAAYTMSNSRSVQMVQEALQMCGNLLYLHVSLNMTLPSLLDIQDHQMSLSYCNRAVMFWQP